MPRGAVTGGKKWRQYQREVVAITSFVQLVNIILRFANVFM